MKLLLKDGRRFLLRFDLKEEILTSLQNFCLTENIFSAWVSAIGSAERVELGFYNSQKKIYEKLELDEDLEIVSLQGNIAFFENKPTCHIHGCFSGKDFMAKSGHVFSVHTSATCEVFLIKLEGKIVREKSENFNLNLLV